MRREPSSRAAILLAGLTLALPSSSSAGLTTAPGTSAAAFLDLGYGARAIGLGEAFVSAADDVAALHYNPAGLAYPSFAVDPRQQGRPYEMLLSESLLVQDIQMTQMGFVARPFGLSVTRLSLGNIEARTSETAQPDANLGASDLAVAATAAHQFFGVGFGASARFVHENIGSNSASAYAFDAGALKRFEALPISVGASLADVGTKMRYIDQAAPLPAVLRVGATYGLTRSFPHAITLEIDQPRDDNMIARLGAEYAGFGPLSLRFGYATQSATQRAAALGKNLGTTASGISEFYGLSIGAGLRTQFGNFDYAIVPYGELGTAQRFAYCYDFGGKK